MMAVTSHESDGASHESPSESRVTVTRPDGDAGDSDDSPCHESRP